MSVYKPKQSPFYHFDFQVGGERFYGSTEQTSRREALAHEKSVRDQAKAALKTQKKLRGTKGQLTLAAATEQYWNEVGTHHANAETTFTDLARLVEFFGSAHLLASIADDDVTRLVEWRRAQKRWGRDKSEENKPAKFISNATVNRSTTLVLKKLFTRAKRSWKFSFPDEPDWRSHWLSEPKERVRELKSSERASIELASRPDYQPIIDFALATGFRMDECLLRWSEVDWESGQIETVGKGQKQVRTRITSVVRDILEAQIGNDPDWVFTYIATRTVGAKGKTPARIKDQRYPITYEGLKSQWKRTRSAAKVENFRFHDLRHDLGTKLLRQTGNMKLVQKALNHADIKTTSRYAHVLDEEVGDALEKLAENQLRDRKSRKKSRSDKAKEA